HFRPYTSFHRVEVRRGAIARLARNAAHAALAAVGPRLLRVSGRRALALHARAWSARHGDARLRPTRARESRILRRRRGSRVRPAAGALRTAAPRYRTWPFQPCV